MSPSNDVLNNTLTRSLQGRLHMQALAYEHEVDGLATSMATTLHTIRQQQDAHLHHRKDAVADIIVQMYWSGFVLYTFTRWPGRQGERKYIPRDMS